MADYRIASLPVGAGLLGLASIPGRGGAYQADLTALLRWGPDLVLTMTERTELLYAGAGTFAEDLEAAGVAWCHLPIPDRGAPPPEVQELWPEVSTLARDIFARGGRVFTHCYGGCGRAGMAALRLIVESGTPPAEALTRLRAVRPCAVETEAQRAWAAMV